MAMSMSERGRLGGLKCLANNGSEHMSKIGKKGFKALCCKFPGNSRRRALQHLNGKGLVKARFITVEHPEADAIAAQLYQEFGLNHDGPEF